MRGRHNRGFTLIELMVVIVIIAVLAAMAIPKFNQIRNGAKNTQTAANVQEIHKGLSQFAVDNGGMYPFRVNFFDDPTVHMPGFDPYDRVNFSPRAHTEPDRPWFSLGLLGGVEVVNFQWEDNTQPAVQGEEGGAKHGGLIQPYAPGWNYGNFYRHFNQHTDPLVASGYLGAYPQNPFMRRPMGAILYGYGQLNGQYDKTIPYEGVVTSPGDFVYTHFYRTVGNDLLSPQGIAPAKKTYTVDHPMGGHLHFYIDLVDSYQLWAYGDLPMNAGRFVAYPNNDQNMSNYNRRPKKDWDNSGTRDMFETGIVQYFRATGAGAAGAEKKGGGQMEF